MNRRFALFGGLAWVLFFAAAGLTGHRRADADASEKPLPDHGAVPRFVLMDQAGKAFGSEQLGSHPWIAGFIFTRCSGQCPIIVERMQEVAKEVSGIPIVAFSVDPEYDTSDVLSAYAKRLGLDVSRWHLLTDWPSQVRPEPACPPAEGCLASVRRLSVEGFHLSAMDGGPPAEPVTHSVRLVLVDGRGRIRGYYDATDSEALARLKRDAQTLMRQS